MSHNPGGKLHVRKHRSSLRAVKFRCWRLHDFIAALLFLVLYTRDVLIYHLFKVGEWRRTLTKNLESKQDFVRYLLEKLRYACFFYVLKNKPRLFHGRRFKYL